MEPETGFFDKTKAIWGPKERFLVEVHGYVEGGDRVL
jgi:hypothetical protein